MGFRDGTTLPFELSILSQSQEEFVPLGVLFKSKLANIALAFNYGFKPK